MTYKGTGITYFLPNVTGRAFNKQSQNHKMTVEVQFLGIWKRRLANETLEAKLYNQILLIHVCCRFQSTVNAAQKFRRYINSCSTLIDYNPTSRRQ